MRRLALSAALLIGCAGAPPRAASPAASTTPPDTEPAARPPEAPTSPPPPSEGAAALARAFEARMTVWTRPDGSRVLTRRCREGPVDCAARIARFAQLIDETARRHDLDPFLLAALAWRESGLDPSALGRRGEAGIVQLHPRGAGRDMRYVRDAAYRAQCQSELDACQGPVLERGAETLARAIEECGSLVSGLGAYATGHCTESARHPQQVLEERENLRRLAEDPAAN